MKTIHGAYGSATIFTTSNEVTAIDDYALAQIQMLCDNEVSKGSDIRVMPDVHPGKVGTIGLTMTVGDKIMPNLVGIDVGCGMTLAKIKGKKMEFQKLDTVIRDNVPSGFAIRTKEHRFADEFDFSRLNCHKHIREDKARLSLGTLGSGNHFIEVDEDEEGNLYVVIHSGSRRLGKEMTEYYLSAGQKNGVPYELTCLEGNLMQDYLHDLQMVQEFAALNRKAIVDELVKGMKWKVLESYDCVHNYVDNSEIPILRKGAISARLGERVIIPINMRDGILLGIGKGNGEWNFSAPHGSGRLMKREEVRANFTVSSYKAEMKGIYSGCINKNTLDEAPFAYRPLHEITEAIQDTVSIDRVLKPVYNYKAGGDSKK